MRISDWSSDVCSSDLTIKLAIHCRQRPRTQRISGRLRGYGAWRRDSFATIEGRLPPRILRYLAAAQVLRYARGTNKAQQELRSEEHTSELQSLMRISYAVFCLKKKIH